MIEKIEKIQDLIAKGQTEEAMKVALDFYRGSQKEKKIRLLMNQWKRNQEAIQLGLRDNMTEANRIVASFINEISEKDSIKGVYSNKLKFKIPVFISLFVCLFLLLGIKWYGNTRYSNEAIFSKYKNVSIVSYETTRATDESFSRKHFNSAVSSFQDADYRTSIKLFEQLREKEPSYYARCTYAIGCCFLFLDEFEQAHQIFNNYLSNVNEGIIMKQHAEWGLLLSKIGKGQLDEEFYQILKEVNLHKRHIFQRYSIELRGDLKSFWRKIAEI